MAELSLSDFLAKNCEFSENAVQKIAAKLEEQFIDKVS
jgi:hypothetical protein